MSNLLTKRWLVRHLLALVVFIILINFGLWQLRRLDQRRTLNAEILAGLNRPVVNLSGETVDPDDLHFRRVSVTGIFDNHEAIVIRNRPLNGQPGVHLVTPLRIKDSEQAVLVNRGWIPQQTPNQNDLRIYDREGELTVEGIAYRSQTRPDGFLSPTDPTRQPDQTRLERWFRIDIERIQRQLRYPLLPIFVEQSPAAAEALPSPPISVAYPELDEGPHLGYALQWFSFALILAVTYVFFARQELKR